MFAAFVDADRLGFDLHLHAIGDGGVRLALDAVQQLRSVTRRSDLRVTVAHAQLIDQRRYRAVRGAGRDGVLPLELGPF